LRYFDHTASRANEKIQYTQQGQQKQILEASLPVVKSRDTAEQALNFHVIANNTIFEACKMALRGNVVNSSFSEI
jgi:hypothetical protein